MHDNKRKALEKIIEKLAKLVPHLGNENDGEALARHRHETSDLHASTATNGRSASECHAKWPDRPSNAMQEPAMPEVALISGRDF
jgi:hypothetical protein